MMDGGCEVGRSVRREVGDSVVDRAGAHHAVQHAANGEKTRRDYWLVSRYARITL
jgi:hypothetical protein